MSRLACLIAVVLLAASPAEAVTSLEQARAGSQAARKSVNEVRGRQMSLRTELNQVAERIEAHKAQQRRGAELDASLRRSQELSGALTEAAQELSRAEAEAEREHLALLGALGNELGRLQAAWERTSDRSQRQALLSRMRGVRQEREQLRSLLPAAKFPALDARGSDDPEDLLEQADMLRDAQDKVRQRMSALEGRLGELRAERELDRRMSDFLGDEALFDDHDRRLRRSTQRELSRGTHPPLSAGTEAPSDLATAPQSGPTEVTASPERSEPSSSPTTSGLSNTGSITQIARGADGRPQVGGLDGRLLEGATTRDIQGLEAELKKLRKVASELDLRASALERRAKEQD